MASGEGMEPAQDMHARPPPARQRLPACARQRQRVALAELLFCQGRPAFVGCKGYTKRPRPLASPCRWRPSTNTLHQFTDAGLLRILRAGERSAPISTPTPPIITISLIEGENRIMDIRSWPRERCPTCRNRRKAWKWRMSTSLCGFARRQHAERGLVSVSLVGIRRP